MARLRLPRPPRLPTIPVPRDPPGWGRTELVASPRPLPFVAQMRERQPAGEIPAALRMRYPSMTKPEWAVWWGLLVNGLKPEIDFTYVATLMGSGASYYSTTDFLLPDHLIAIEVQGEFWHYGQGSNKQMHDRMRYVALAQQGYLLIFIDEDDALSRPQWVVREALAGRDHSKLTRRF